jgi:peptidyl-dipeptidase A
MTNRDLTPGLDRREFLRRGAAVAAGTMRMGTTARGGSPHSAAPAIRDEAEAFLAGYVRGWLPLETAASEASWAASTDVSEAHTAAQVAANQKVNEYVGAPEVIARVKRLLEHKTELDDITVRQLEKVRLRAAEAPGTVPEVVRARTEAEAKQAAAQDGFVYVLKREGKPEEHPSANDIDRVGLAIADGQKPTLDGVRLSRVRRATPAPLVSEGALLAPSNLCSFVESC